MKKGQWIFILLLVFIVVFSVSCTENHKEDTSKEETGLAEDEQLEQEDIASQDPSSSANTPVAYRDIKLTPIDIFDIYMKKYPNTKVKKIELDQDYKSYLYEIEGFDGEKEYELKIHPITGEIIKEEIESDQDYNEGITRDQVEKIQAIVDDALKEAGKDAELEEWTMKIKNGKVQIEVEIEREGLEDIENTYNIQGNLLKKED